MEFLDKHHSFVINRASRCSLARNADTVLTTNLAFVRLDVRVDDHVSLESLFLHKSLEAHVALVGPYVGVDENVTLHVGQQGELATADATLVLLHPLEKKKTWKLRHVTFCMCVLFYGANIWLVLKCLYLWGGDSTVPKITLTSNLIAPI